MADLSHLDERGQARMVDIGNKDVTRRLAVARAEVAMRAETLALLIAGGSKKGDVIAAARIAGISAAKKTSELIPLCHAIQLTQVELGFEPDTAASRLRIEVRVHALDRTGAEMEALTAASIAALTVYDMLKSVDREMSIERVALYEKDGGKSGHFVRP